MKTVMRQSLDGVTQIVDPASRRERAAGVGRGVLRWNWTNALVWYMRTLAWVWVAKGLFNWSLVLGAMPGYGDFTALPRPLQGSVVFFAAVDLLAAVGLWLAAPWGGVVWLLCAAIETVSPALGVRGMVSGVLVVGVNLALMAFYFFLSWQAGQERA